MSDEQTTRATFVICCECGSSIFLNDPESLVHQDAGTVMVRCLNNCCGHVSCYPAAELRPSLESQVVDHSTDILLHG